MKDTHEIVGQNAIVKNIFRLAGELEKVNAELEKVDQSIMARQALMTSQLMTSQSMTSPSMPSRTSSDISEMSIQSDDFESSLESSACGTCPDCRMGTPLFFKTQQIANAIHGTDSKNASCSHEIIPCKDFGSKMSLSDSAISSNGTLDFKL